MTRIALAIVSLAAVACCNISAAQAQTYGNAPWCAVREMGTGDVQWDCEYASAAECAPTVVAGNRGFCNVNPYYGTERPPDAPRVWPHSRRHRHYAHHD